MRTLLVSVLIFAVAQAPQYPPPAFENASDVFVVANGRGVETRFDAEAFAKLPRATVRAKGHDGKESEFAGVPLIELLRRCDVATGEKLRGKALANHLLVEAADGYKVAFALPELDPAFTDRVVLLADRRDGTPLGRTHGPYQIIVPGEKRHARWVRMVTRLAVRGPEAE